LRRFCGLPLPKMTIAQLRSLASKMHVDLSDCLDKSDMVDKIKLAQAQENETKKNRVKVDPIPDAGMGFANPLGEMNDLNEEELRRRRERMRKEAEARRSKEEPLTVNRPKELDEMIEEEKRTGQTAFNTGAGSNKINQNMSEFEKVNHEWSRRAFEELRKKRKTNPNAEQTLRGSYEDPDEDAWWHSKRSPTGGVGFGGFG